MKVNVQIEAEGLWSAFWGSGYEADPVTRNWLMNVEFLDGARWDKAGTARIWFVPEDTEDETDFKYSTEGYQSHCLNKDVTVAVIVETLGKVMAKGYGHCGDPIDTDFDYWDSCVTDLLLQVIAYGKEVWA